MLVRQLPSLPFDVLRRSRIIKTHLQQARNEAHPGHSQRAELHLDRT